MSDKPYKIGYDGMGGAPPVAGTPEVPMPIPAAKFPKNAIQWPAAKPLEPGDGKPFKISKS